MPTALLKLVDASEPAPQPPASVRPDRPRPVRVLMEDLGYPADWQWAWDNYKPAVLAIAHEYGLTRHLEIGGGRDPLFQPGELDALGAAVTLNDISAAELALAPPGFRGIAHDICAPDAPDAMGRGTYDFAYSRMLMEHVADVPAMWRNMHALLAPGGVALAFFPTLYAPVFALNRVIPERLARAALEAVFPDRKPDGDNPKFPAFYDHCFSREARMLPMLGRAGFTDVTILPFYGYSYFWKFPGLRQLSTGFTALAQRRDWRAVSSFAYVIARK